MMFATKKIVPAMAAAILLFLNQWIVEAVESKAARTKNLRNGQDTNNAIQNDPLGMVEDQLMEETPGSSGRKLATTWSYEYKYQTMYFCWNGWLPGYCWRDTEYRWCVEDTQYSCFPSSIGSNEFWDNDRIKRMDNGSGMARSCSSRTDIGSGTCTWDSSHKDWTGVSCSGKTFDVYMC